MCTGYGMAGSTHVCGYMGLDPASKIVTGDSIGFNLV